MAKKKPMQRKKRSNGAKLRINIIADKNGKKYFLTVLTK